MLEEWYFEQENNSSGRMKGEISLVCILVIYYISYVIYSILYYIER